MAILNENDIFTFSHFQNIPVLAAKRQTGRKSKVNVSSAVIEQTSSEKSTRNMSDYVAPVTAVLLPHLGAVAGGIFARRNLDVWYEGLKYPTWRPPNKVFPVVWTTLYSSMGYASYLVWKDAGGFRGGAAGPLALYGTQLALNWAWTPIFFGLRSPKWAFVDSVCLLGGIAGTIIMFHRVNVTAAYLLFPYFGWVSFATYLNYRIWRDNSEQKEE